ncbi:hypothetical protein KCTC52924_03357 [Arenibacter antarcticus]|uniref:DUF2490 domain-containing protein n=1 Tax=Arenibacter antarcticus TaxID=2040469 RepID=A0ABW5VGL4_9FLAO|nr:DUF2490 domain-containing protein [Arenibacter sp. H213]MCM4166424.1 DUF2490 domain-containing protein [Arenibacter sp. H213]
MRRILGLCLFFYVFNLSAQETGDHKLGSWHNYIGNTIISEKISLLTEVQLRFYDQAENFNEMVLRTGVNYHFVENAHFTVGYAYLRTDETFDEFPGEIKVNEHRVFEQFTLKNRIWEIDMEHRYGLEQRFLDFGNRTDVQHRGRYRLQVTFPLTDIFFINLSEEVLLNLQDDIFDQNRLYAGLGVNVTHNLSVEAGFLKTHFSQINYERLVIGVNYNPDLRGIFKKK